MQILTNSYEIKLPLLWIFLKMLLFSGVMNNMSQMLSIEHVSKAEHLKLLYTFFFRSRPVCIYFPRRYVASQQVSESKRMDSWFPLLFLRSESNFSHLRFVQFGFSQLILITLHTHTMSLCSSLLFSSAPEILTVLFLSPSSPSHIVNLWL